MLHEEALLNLTPRNRRVKIGDMKIHDKAAWGGGFVILGQL